MLQPLIQQIQVPVTIPDITTAVETSFVLEGAFKLIFIFLGLMYVIFAIVVVRQVAIMNETIATKLGPLIQILAWLNLAWALLLFAGIFLFL